MEEIAKDQLSVTGNMGGSAKLLRYPLRSGTKTKEEKPPVVTPSSSASRRGRPASSVSKSVNVLDLSSKDKPAKPPRRLSIPTKSGASPAPKPFGNITPISQAIANKSVSSQSKSETPVSNVSRSLNRRKFSVLSSASYWLSQIKLSEDAAKHSLSIGFFKLALEAGCEPLQRMKDELKSYARRHNLLDLGEPAKELFQSYDILETIEQLQVSETCSQVPEEGIRLSDDEVHSSSPVMGDRKLKPKSSNNSSSSAVKESTKESTQKTAPVSRIRASANKKTAILSSASEAGRHKTQKKSQRPSKPESSKEKQMVKNDGKTPAYEEGACNHSPAEVALEENKENMDATQMEEISLVEV